MKGSLVVCLLCLPLCRGSADNLRLIPLPDLALLLNVEVEYPLLTPDPWHVWDNNTAVVGAFISGKKVERKFGDFYESLRGYHDYCDFLTTYEPLRESWYYTPATCVPAEECLKPGPFALSSWGNLTCRTKANNIRLTLGSAHIGQEKANSFVCCPLNGTKLWKEFVERENEQNPDRRHLEFREIPPSLDLENVPYASVSSRNYDNLPHNDKVLLENFFEQKRHERFINATVCGFVRDEERYFQKNNLNLYRWFPYVCVKPSECGKGAKDGQYFPQPNPLWHQFCSDKYTPELNPRHDVRGEQKHIFRETNEDTFCCHINDVGNKYLKGEGERYIATSQIPSFFRVAPGLRSLYKCEEYSKRVCSHKLCSPGLFYPPRPGDNPHMASLGVIYPNIMMFHCGGTLISLRYIISTAGCKLWWGYQVNVVMLGEHKTSSYRYGKERVYTITEITQPFGYPPAFRPKPWQESGERPVSDVIDLALYKTDVDVKFTKYIRPACLWHGHHSWSRFPQFLGWGSRDTYRSDYLETLTALQPTKVCTTDSFYRDTVENPFYGRFGALHGWMVCLKDPAIGDQQPDGHTNPCLLDLGGPLQEKVENPYCSTLLLGVLSSRNLCKRQIPSVFTNISQFLGAIEDEVWGSYLFLDMPSERFEKARCGRRELLFFFNKCVNGNECVTY